MQHKLNSLLSIKFYKVHLPLAKLKTSRTNNGYHPSSQLDKQIYPIFTHLTRSSHFEGLLRHNAEMKWGDLGASWAGKRIFAYPQELNSLPAVCLC